MGTGPVKRLAVLVGAATVFLAVYLLTNTVTRGEIECGSAVNSTNRHVDLDTYSRLCDGPIRRQRWVGGTILAAGTVVLVVGNPRSLLSRD